MEKQFAYTVHSISHSESSKIFWAICSDNVFRTFIAKGIRSRKTKKLPLFALAPVELVFYPNKNEAMYLLKEGNLKCSSSDLGGITESCLRDFVAETLYHLGREHGSESALFELADWAFKQLSHQDISRSEFPIHYMLQVLQSLGVLPDESHLAEIFSEAVLDRKQIAIVQRREIFSALEKNQLLLKNGSARKRVLQELLRYFQESVDAPLRLKSVDVLSEVLG